MPYAFSEVFPKLTLGTWTYIFQGLLVITLMVLKKGCDTLHRHSIVKQNKDKILFICMAVFKGCRENLDFIGFLVDLPIVYTLFIPLEDRIGIAEIT